MKAINRNFKWTKKIWDSITAHCAVHSRRPQLRSSQKWNDSLMTVGAKPREHGFRTLLSLHIHISRMSILHFSTVVDWPGVNNQSNESDPFDERISLNTTHLLQRRRFSWALGLEAGGSDLFLFVSQTGHRAMNDQGCSTDKLTTDAVTKDMHFLVKTYWKLWRWRSCSTSRGTDFIVWMQIKKVSRVNLEHLEDFQFSKRLVARSIKTKDSSSQATKRLHQIVLLPIIWNRRTREV